MFDPIFELMFTLGLHFRTLLETFGRPLAPFWGLWATFWGSLGTPALWTPFRKNEKGSVPSGKAFLLFFATYIQKDAPTESLGAGHVFLKRLSRSLDPRTLDPLEPARANRVFPFSAPRPKRSPFQIHFENFGDIWSPFSTFSVFIVKNHEIR